MSQAMVTAYVESLLEQLTGTEKMRPDHEGDYPVRYRDASYYVRVTGTDARPVVQVFSTALIDVEPQGDLFAELNDINSRLCFSRCFWVRGQVLFEAEHLGLSLGPTDFDSLVTEVARASDSFAPRLHERFGGRLAYAQSKGPDAVDAVSTAGAGGYL